MLRDFLSIGHNAMRERIGVAWATFLALFTLWPAAELGITPGGSGFGLRTDAAEQRANVYFVSAVRAFHPANLPAQSL